ncbi:MAG TPA: type II secretion system protein [Rhabdochlamydiaceae bacterium]|nr:type II secretion system protein [Rhabdochlamydiaceae bacterium]
MQNNRKRKGKFPFTLIEITLCLVLLGLISAVLAWQIKDMIDVHRFQKHIDLLLTDMRKVQTLALTYQTDFDIKIFKKNDHFFYTIATDEPIKNMPVKKPKALEGVINLTFNNHELNNLDFRVYSNGRIEPLGVIGFLPKQTSEEMEGLWVDLRTPIQIKLLQQLR